MSRRVTQEQSENVRMIASRDGHYKKKKVYTKARPVPKTQYIEQPSTAGATHTTRQQQRYEPLINNPLHQPFETLPLYKKRPARRQSSSSVTSSGRSLVDTKDTSADKRLTWCKVYHTKTLPASTVTDKESRVIAAAAAALVHSDVVPGGSKEQPRRGKSSSSSKSALPPTAIKCVKELGPGRVMPMVRMALTFPLNYSKDVGFPYDPNNPDVTGFYNPVSKTAFVYVFQSRDEKLGPIVKYHQFDLLRRRRGVEFMHQRMTGTHDVQLTVENAPLVPVAPSVVSLRRISDTNPLVSPCLEAIEDGVPLKCWHCTQEMPDLTKVVSCPIRHCPTTKRYTMLGYFCMWPCAAAWVSRYKDVRSRLDSLSYMRAIIRDIIVECNGSYSVGRDGPIVIRQALPKETLIEYGGSLTRDMFKEHAMHINSNANYYCNLDNLQFIPAQFGIFHEDRSPTAPALNNSVAEHSDRAYVPPLHTPTPSKQRPRKRTRDGVTRTTPSHPVKIEETNSSI